MKGVVEYDAEGKPKCELCGKNFHRVLTHVRQKHAMTEREYKIMFGFDLIKGITSLASKLKSRQAVLDNYEKVVVANLLLNGLKTRFKKGSEGRKRETVSQQTKIMLGERARNSMTMEVRKERGREIGLTGLGNAKRWGKKS